MPFAFTGFSFWRFSSGWSSCSWLIWIGEILCYWPHILENENTTNVCCCKKVTWCSTTSSVPLPSMLSVLYPGNSYTGLLCLHQTGLTSPHVYSCSAVSKLTFSTYIHSHSLLHMWGRRSRSEHSISQTIRYYSCFPMILLVRVCVCFTGHHL